MTAHAARDKKVTGMKMRLAMAFTALLALAACGFQPMYAPTALGPEGAVVGAIAVPEVPGKAGHAFRTEFTRLLDIERGRGGPEKRLEITVKEQIIPLGLRIDETATRADLILTGGYKLFDAQGAEVAKGQINATASYDIPVAAYGAAAAQDDARERAGVTLAQRLRTDIALRLRARKADEATKAASP